MLFHTTDPDFSSTRIHLVLRIMEAERDGNSCKCAP